MAALSTLALTHALVGGLIGLLATVASAQTPDVDRQRVQTAYGLLRTRLADGVAEGRFIERFSGSVVFAPSVATLPELPIANPDALGKLAAGPLLTVKGVLDPSGWLTVTEYTVQPLSPLGVRLSGRGVLPGWATSSEALTKAITDAVHLDAPSTEPAVEARALTTIRDTARAKMRALETSYSAALAGKDAAAMRDLAAEWKGLREYVGATLPDSDEFKALFGHLDNYPPWRYERIFRQAPSVVAIAEPGKDRARCSGVLIAVDLVLTAGHCFSGKPRMEPTELEVWFGYADQPDEAGPLPIQRRKIAGIVAPGPERVKALLAGEFGPTLLDYAIVRLAPGPAGTPTPSEATPQCVRDRLLHRWDAIYVVGYPLGGRIRVHDSARVYLPLRVVDEDFPRFRLEIEADLVASNQPDHARLMAEFDASYVKLPATTALLEWWELRHLRDAAQPRMGIIADTFRGNSGGPVYDRDGFQCVVGVFTSGSTDTGVRLTPSWSAHERVLPISAILRDLGDHESTKSVLNVLSYEPGADSR
jgi:hypothetical protein